MAGQFKRVEKRLPVQGLSRDRPRGTEVNIETFARNSCEPGRRKLRSAASDNQDLPAIQIVKSLDINHCDQNEQFLAIHTTLYILGIIGRLAWLDRRAQGSRFSQSTLSTP
ncbi:MAG: hypothetical protein DMG76_20870 [Acidobacteria bacterium]|nr:MAG: hypothetical protein DMG76_20870 [Acidobacteriota bacterium]